MTGTVRLDRETASVLPLLRTVIRRRTMDSCRRAKRFPGVPIEAVVRADESDDPCRSAVREDTAQWVRRALECLPPKMQLVARTHWLEGRTVSETAAYLGIAAGTAHVHAKRAARHLRETPSGLNPVQD